LDDHDVTTFLAAELASSERSSLQHFLAADLSRIEGSVQAYMALNDVDAAAVSFARALKVEPLDAAIKKELGIAKKRIAEKRDKERSVYARMFQ
ncbi:hypothetical protein L7F22_028958, partial [Adiantum nelumboides]|nr:hypothetical protein [Adiantum nelumboides]